MLNLFIGPMYSGKTTTLLSRLERYKIGGKKCMIIKYINDKRYSDTKVATHDNHNHDAISTKLLHELNDNINDVDVIMIDEIQFYEDGAFMADTWANKGKIVECFGLNGDYQRKPFEQISLIIPLCDNITHLTAIDSINGKEASFTYRTIDSNEKELIGGKDMYMALSRDTYVSKSNLKMIEGSNFWKDKN